MKAKHKRTGGMKVGESRVIRFCDFGIKIVPDDGTFADHCKDLEYCQMAAKSLFYDEGITIVESWVTDPLEGFAYGGCKKGVLCIDEKGERYYMEAHQDRSCSSLSRAMACADALHKRLLDEYGPDDVPYLHVGFITEEDEFGRGNMHTNLSRVDSQGLPFDDGYSIHYLWLGKYMQSDWKVTIKSCTGPDGRQVAL